VQVRLDFSSFNCFSCPFLSVYQKHFGHVQPAKIVFITRYLIVGELDLVLYFLIYFLLSSFNVQEQ